MLALLYRLTGNIVWSAKALGILCHALASALLARAVLAVAPVYLLLVVTGVLFRAQGRGARASAPH